MPYCFMHLRPAKEGDGREPDFPDGVVGYALLADCRPADWGLYEFELDEANDNWNPRTSAS